MNVDNLREDAEHNAVCDSDARHLVVVAPPGCGKTLLAVRLAGIYASKLEPPSKVLVLTFSTQARSQLEHEARRQIPGALRNRVEISNYHRFFWSAVRAHRRALGLNMLLDIGSSGRRKNALREQCPKPFEALQEHPGLIECLAEHRFPEFHDERTPQQKNLVELLQALDRELGGGRLVFDDLGALYWQLLENFPVLHEAYSSLYPIVLADEHQDASALQDAVVRRLGTRRLVILADPMQLIHGFRGASAERLDHHMKTCDAVYQLRTAHRWHGEQQISAWLLSMRDRLQGHNVPGASPNEVEVKWYNAQYGMGAVENATKLAVISHFQSGLSSVVVISRTRTEVAQIHSYLLRNGLYSRQIGGDDFEEAREDIEQLPLIENPRAVALRALDRVASLVPTLEQTVRNQVRNRLLDDGVNLTQAGASARRLLVAFSHIYEQGASAFFHAVGEALLVCEQLGHKMARPMAVRALQSTAGSTSPTDSLGENLAKYSEDLIAQSYVPSHTRRGLFSMTAHQSKGKEFDGVILCNVSANLFRDTDDDRRLFYVAMTRATKRWTIIAPHGNHSPIIQCVSDNIT